VIEHLEALGINDGPMHRLERAVRALAERPAQTAAD
jgi:hypothetical protein